MTAIAAELAARSIATLRFQFPYMERRSAPRILRRSVTRTVRAAVAESRAPRARSCRCSRVADPSADA
jgi:predicted alpha/beta-hydrolase family hydrolase